MQRKLLNAFRKNVGLTTRTQGKFSFDDEVHRLAETDRHTDLQTDSQIDSHIGLLQTDEDQITRIEKDSLKQRKNMTRLFCIYNLLYIKCIRNIIHVFTRDYVQLCIDKFLFKRIYSL